MLENASSKFNKLFENANATIDKVFEIGGDSVAVLHGEGVRSWQG